MCMRDYKFRRGQVWLAKDAYKSTGRPVVVLSADLINGSNSQYVTVALCTSNLSHKDLVGKVSYKTYEGNVNLIQCDSVTRMLKDDLVNYLSTLDRELMDEVENALMECLGIKPIVSKKVDLVEAKNGGTDNSLELAGKPGMTMTGGKKNKAVADKLEAVKKFLIEYKELGAKECAEKMGISAGGVYSKVQYYKKKYPSTVHDIIGLH